MSTRGPVGLGGAHVADHRRHGGEVLGEALDQLATELLDAVVEGLDVTMTGVPLTAQAQVSRSVLFRSPRRHQRDDASRDILEPREQPRPRRQARARTRPTPAQAARHGQSSPTMVWYLSPGPGRQDRSEPPTWL